MTTLELRNFPDKDARRVAVRWVSALVHDGMDRVVALRLVGCTGSQYYRWKKGGAA